MTSCCKNLGHRCSKYVCSFDQPQPLLILMSEGFEHGLSEQKVLTLATKPPPWQFIVLSLRTLFVAEYFSTPKTFNGKEFLGEKNTQKYIFQATFSSWVNVVCLTCYFSYVVGTTIVKKVH